MRSLWALVLLAASGCNSVPIDPSVRAVETDYTVVMTANETAPGRGLDILRVKAGSPVSNTWTLVLPHASGVKGGEADAQYRGQSAQYGIQEGQAQLDIPLKDLIGHGTWEASDAGTAVVFVALNIDAGTGMMPVKARGFLFIVVTDPSYDPLAIDSGYIADKTTCKEQEVQFSTAGRTAIKCR